MYVIVNMIHFEIITGMGRRVKENGGGGEFSYYMVDIL
jgi:hypothetical protein